MKNAKIFTTEHDRIQNLETTKQTFEISEAENGVKKINYDQQFLDSEEKTITKKSYQPNRLIQIVNYLLCRADLAKKKLDEKPVAITDLFRYTNLFDKCIIFVGIFCAVLSGIGQPAIAVISGKITNVLLTQSPESEEFHKSALFFIYLYLCVGIATLIINYIQFICFQSTCFRIVARLQKQYIRAILRQNSAWFDRNKSGELTTRLNENIEHLRKGIGDKLGLLIRGIAMFISSQIIAFFFQWRLALVMFPVAPISCFIMAKLAQRTDAALEKELDDSSKAGVIAEECIIGVRTVQAFNGQQEMVERYRRQLCKGKKYGISRSCWSGMLDGLFFFVLLIFLGIGFLYGGYLLKIGIFKNPGELFTVVFSIVMGSYFLGLVSPHLMVLLNARTAAATIYQIIDRQPKIDASCKDGLSFDVIKGKISFKDIHFRYPSRKNVQVLKQLNLIVEPGQKVALVGQSGCGKSTLIGLLTRMYEQESGIVSIDDMPVNEANIRWLRNVIGVVEQEPVLFTDTVEENLRLGDPNANLEQMIEVCRIANAHDFILKLPQGYKTRIGDGGVQLSGGQKQRVAIARTLIRNSKILLLDEATSALDVKSENAVLEALKNALIGRTVIIIAHRFSSIRNADRIVVIDKGTITEQGNHNELIAIGGSYAQLLQAQQIRQADNNDLKNDGSNIMDVPHCDSLDAKAVEEDQVLPQNESVYRNHRSSTTKSFVKESDTFIRGASGRHSMSLSRIGNSSSAIGVDSFVPASDPIFAGSEMSEEDCKSSFGFITIFKNAQGNYILMVAKTKGHDIYYRLLSHKICCLVVSIIWGAQLPAISWLLTFAFKIYQDYEQTKSKSNENVDHDHMIDQLYLLIAFYGILGLMVFVTNFISNSLSGVVSENVILSIRCRALLNILHQDAAYFDNPSHAAGNLITRLASDAPNIKMVLDSRMLQVIFGISAFSICTIIGFIYSWQVTLTGISLSLVLSVLQAYLSRWVYYKNLLLMKEDKAGSLAVEIIEGVRTIQLLTRENVFHSKYSNACSIRLKHELQKTRIEAINFAISQTFQYFMLALSYAVGIHIIVERWKEYHDPQHTAHIFSAIVAHLLGGIGLMNSTIYFPEFIKARSSAKLLFTVTERKSKLDELEEGEKIDIAGNISFHNVSFSYPRKREYPVMNKIQFNVAKGQTVALIGSSGAGKSTVISLLERFYDPDSGSVRFDGKDLRKLNLYHLRSQMALVGQNAQLFSGSIKENVCFGLKESVSTDRVLEALQLANARTFVESLPMGLETEIGEKGTLLSGGQRQRIAIARAVIRNPKILLLDEATSALDSESENMVQKALDQVRMGCTCITIAHRLSSVQNSDQIICIENGYVQEIGTHESLIAKGGYYCDLIQQQ